MPFFVYLLRTSKNTLYTGQTNNLKRRIKEHQSKKAKTAKYLRLFASFTLVYQEEYSSRLESMKRERQIKTWSKAKKEALVSRKSI